MSEALRNSVVFAVQNLITDPPFSKMDLVSCRNLLIYLEPETQSRLIPLFNFALNSSGVLFLGKSEGVGGAGSDLFAPSRRRPKSTAASRRPGRSSWTRRSCPAGRRRCLAAPLLLKPPAASYADAIRLALLGHFAASVVLVGRKGQILQFHGQTGKYLNMPTGEPNLNLLDIAKEGLALRLRSALHTAINSGKPVVLDQVPVTRDGSSHWPASPSCRSPGLARRSRCWP